MNIYDVVPNAHSIPTGDTAWIQLEGTSQAGVDYLLYRNGSATGQTLSGTNTPTIQFGATQPGAYTIMAEQGACQQPMQGTSQVSFNATSCGCSQSIGIFPPSGEVCSGDSVEVGIQGGLSTGTYTLFLNGNQIRTATVTNCNQGFLGWQVANPGTYTVTGPCLVSGQSVITQKTTGCNTDPSCPTTSIAWDAVERGFLPDDICEGSLTLEATNNETGNWYYRAFGSNESERTLLATGTNSITINDNRSGHYYFQTSASCPESSIPLTFKPAMSGLAITGDTFRCQNSGTTQYVAKGNNVDAFTWNVTGANTDDYAISIVSRADSSVATVSWDANYTGTAQVQATAFGCGATQNTLSVSVTTQALPVATITPMGSTVIPLGSDILTLEANAGTGLSYQWLVNGVSLPGETNRMFNAFGPGNYQVDVTLNGCTARSAVTTITQENNHNYVITRVLRVEDDGMGSPIEENSLYVLSSDQKNESISYLDGLGRPIQDVLWQASPQVTDQVAPRTYDSRGREFQQYLPYVGGSNGYFQDNGTTQAINYYNSGSNAAKGVVQDATPYGATVFEASPLSRPVQQGAPGTNFQPGTGQAMGYQYPVNTAGEVKRWLLNDSELPYQQGTYPAGRLSVNEQSDEDGRVTRTYTDRLGRTVLSRVVLDGGTNSFQDTYYVYDAVNRLRYVLPPEGSDNYIGSAGTPSAADSTLLNQWAFQYDYDERNNITRKRVPGSGWHYMIYDSRDRVILSQDGRQREQDEWSFTHYDALNRPIVEGLYYSNQSLSQMQATVATFLASNENNGKELSEEDARYRLHGNPSLTLNNYEGQHLITATTSITLTEGFSIKNFSDETVTLTIAPAPTVVNNPTFPPLDESQPLQLHYYDDHDFDGDASPDVSYDASELTAQQVDLFPVLTGKLTGTKTKVLTSGLWLTEAMFYDDKGRVVQTQRENSIGGQDIVTTQYSFHGLVLGEWHRQTSDGRHGSEDKTVHTRNEYDQADRLTATYQTIDANDTLLLASYAYNEIGELIDKRLHEESANQYLQSVDFRYGIRGWLTSINGDRLSTTEQQATGIVNATSADDLFAQALDYDNTVAGLTTSPAFNGNISAIRWQASGQVNPSAYVYGYDSANRLTTGNYFAGSGTAWQASGNFDVSNLAYDKNGNITALRRNAADGSTMDDLVYGYGTGNNRSNQLVSVEDAGVDTLGFMDGSTVAIEYLYDGSGNLTQDLNKSLDSIGYNHLNLPELVRFSSGNQIRYYYDAQGTKLQQEVSNAGTTTETDYVAGRQYKNGQLDLLMHAEGRTVFEGASFTQHYDLKDHLGNVRLTFAAEQTQASMSASMETGGNSPALEEQYFDNIAETRQTLEFHNATQPNTDEPQPNKVATLNAANGRTQGPTLKQVVHRGDSIHLEVKASYEEHSKKKVQANGILASITSLFNPSMAGYEAVGATETLNEALAGTTLLNRDKTGVPKAYLNYVVLNEDQVIVDQGFVPVSEAAKIEKGKKVKGKGLKGASGRDSVQHETLVVDLAIAEDGYLYTYVSNESNWDVDVHFDQMTMSMSSSQPTVVQVNDYYPFGLTHTQPLSNPTNKYLFQGAELTDDLGLGWYDFGLRNNYRADLGRWGSIDPAADAYYSHSAYHFGGNNPISAFEINGAMYDDGGSGLGMSPFDMNQQGIDPYASRFPFLGQPRDYIAGGASSSNGDRPNPVGVGSGSAYATRLAGNDPYNSQLSRGSHPYYNSKNTTGASLIALGLMSTGVALEASEAGSNHISSFFNNKANYNLGLSRQGRFGFRLIPALKGGGYTLLGNFASEASSLFKAGGFFVNSVGVSISAFELVDAIDRGDLGGGTKAAYDLGAGSVGFFGVPGLIFSSSYFIMSNYVFTPKKIKEMHNSYWEKRARGRGVHRRPNYPKKNRR
ncbi:DUF6443 domain-containing protein [Tunicatimonas pelagia]|uniref:DUF6443 domain-containing protein n=1 Tax=Tunicatimonas pelagia TaxID=931531 RepID=UPI002666FC1E|nr:DUF6443 domain-containing protein [Tunicatimonas pelagia]WKN43205.1 DUF6443 domain-containing protein [Tunicatimonas pelagia]